MTTLAPPRPDSETSGSDPLLALACPACHAALAAPRTTAGTAARCPVCQQAFLVPQPPQRAQDARDRLVVLNKLPEGKRCILVRFFYPTLRPTRSR